MDAIRIEGLTKHYSVGFWRPRRYTALDHLTLRVAEREVFGFLGPNGAGKTTTLKLLMQLMFPSEGTAEILGKPVGDVSVRRRIGYLPEHPYFYENLTAEELLSYFASLFGYHGQERAQRVSRLLDDVGLGAERRFQLRKYSKGMLQRVGLAQALINDPELVFLDEPMSGLDPIGRAQVRDLILTLRDRGVTVFFSSHILSDAEAICSRVGILAAGKLAAAGSLTEIVPFKIHGWDLVVGGAPQALLDELTGGGATVTRISDDRYRLLLSDAAAPDAIVGRVSAAGGTIVSLNPLRKTLEDFFMAQVGQTAARHFD
ncbi:MAG TPA: ABC transporter ATP-binding protein [Vicinamibacterales bacterium]|nr:ABC transporter ATP-binding protein [Vicinamibacterales bacterium]